MNADNGLGSGPLEEGARLSVYRPPSEVVGRGIADIELNGWIEPDNLNQVRRKKISCLLRLSESWCSRGQEGHWKDAV